MFERTEAELGLVLKMGIDDSKRENGEQVMNWLVARKISVSSLKQFRPLSTTHCCVTQRNMWWS